MAITYTPTQADAVFEGFSGQPFDDPIAYTAADNKRIDSKFFLKPIQDEVLNLISLSLEGGAAIAVRNETGAALAAGDLVYLSGYSAGNGWLVTKADADDITKLAAFVMDAALADMTNGVAYARRTISGLNTTGAAVGDPVYLSSTAGGWTLTPPADPAVEQVVGTVRKVDAAAGEIRFHPADSASRTENYTWSGVHEFRSALRFDADLTPAQITADQNDYNPAGLASASFLRLTSDASHNVTGLAGGSDGRILTLHNAGTFNIVLMDESVSSAAANRFALDKDFTLKPDGAVLFQYDATTQRWRMIGGGGSGPGGSGTLNALAKWTPDGATLGDSRITDDGTDFGFGGVMKLGLGTIPAAFAAASGAGADSTFVTEGAQATSGAKGADFVIDLGAGDGTFNDGGLALNFLGTGDQLRLSQTAAGDLTIEWTPNTIKYGALVFQGSNGFLTANNIGIGGDTAIFGGSFLGFELRDTFGITWSSTATRSGAKDLGLGRDAVNVMKWTDGLVSDPTVLKLGVNGAAPTAFADAAGAGKDAHWRGQGAFATSGAKGGDFIIEPGAGDGAGAPGKFTLRQPGGTPGTDDLQLWHDGTSAFIDTFSGDIVFRTAGPVEQMRVRQGTVLLPRKNTTGDPGGVNGDVYYNDADGKFRAYENGAWADLVGGGSTLPVVDTTAIAKGSVDATKQVRFEVDGLTTGTTRTLIMGDRDVSLATGGTFAEEVHTHAAVDIASGTLLHERGGLEADLSLFDGFVVIEGGVTKELQSERAKTVAPGATDDANAGYAVGSRWIDTTADKEYVCLDATAGAAVWTETTQAAGAGGGPTTVVKTADEWVNNTTTGATLQDDDHLTLALSASTKYFFKFFLRIITDSATPDIKIALNGPVTPAQFWAEVQVGNTSGSTLLNAGGLVTAYDTVGTAINWAGAADTFIRIFGYIETGSNVTQPLVLRWAQRSANSAKTWVKLGSWMEVTKV